MTLAAGTTLGPYEILSALGAGGMGEVYRARDPRLDRVVAIKVLPAAWSADEERRRRFVQEARAASALNHPNIVTIHEIESADGGDFIVMEYVTGKSLDRLIPRQGMPLGEVLRIAIPIADALARAHGRGIVHRDLKPANVMVGAEGEVKLLDFGLAKLVTPQDARWDDKAETQERELSPISHLGTLAGTVGYMSPEQASGRAVDARTDVFSFGALLYEMTTGRRPFASDSPAATLAAIARDQPRAPSEVAPGLPRDLERLILRCLRKEVDRRFQSMLDVKLELEQVKEDSDSRPAPAPAMVPRTSRGLMVAATMTVVVGGAAWLLTRPPRPQLPTPHVVPLTTTRGTERRPTFAPDGEQVAFSWNGEKSDNTDIYIKLIGSSEVHRLTTDPARDGSPSWSPDGRQIAFVRLAIDAVGGTIHLVSPLGGGSDRKLSPFSVLSSPPSWSPDGRWLAVSHDQPANDRAAEAAGIYLVSLDGAEPRVVTRAPVAGIDEAPAFSPDGRQLAYASCQNQSGLGPCDVHILELGPDFLPTGPPRRVTRQGLGIHGLAWTRDGTSIIFEGYVGMELSRLWRVGVDGRLPPERIEIAGHGATSPAIARSRDRLAYVSLMYGRAIFRFEVGRPAQILLASSSFSDGTSQFSPDSQRLAFESLRSGETSEIWLAAADGSDPRQLTHGPGRWQGSPYWSPDGQRIAFDSQGEDGHWDIWTVDVEGGAPRRLTQDPGDENRPSWSQDGRWLYFSSARSGTSEVWRVPAGGGTETRVTRGGGVTLALESGDGRQLLFKRKSGPGLLLALPLAGGPERTLIDCVSGEPGFGVGGGAVIYAGCEDEPELHRLDTASGRDRILGKLEKYTGDLITVSPDGKTILYTRLLSEGTSDLMLIEDFR